MSIACKLKELLRANNVEVIALAEYLGISPYSLEKYLDDWAEPSFALLVKIAKYFSVNLNYFADDE